MSGTTTVVRGEFVSRWFRPRRGLVLQLTAARGGDHRVRPFDESYLVSIRIRSAHHGWSQWQPLSATIKPDLPLSLLFTVGTRLAMSLWEPVAGPRQVPLQQVQMRIVDRITSTATVDDVFTIHNGC